MRRTALAAVVTAALALTGCGSSSGGDDPTLAGPSSAATPQACTSQPSTNPGLAGSKDLTTKPKVQVPTGPPPCDLVVSDLVTGSGAQATAGKTITVKYVGVTYADGHEFDASWGGQDFTFALGGGQVISGWDQGFAGMKVGGRRELVIPPDLGYGDQGAGADIPPGATLVFVVDLVKVA